MLVASNITNASADFSSSINVSHEYFDITGNSVCVTAPKNFECRLRVLAADVAYLDDGAARTAVTECRPPMFVNQNQLIQGGPKPA
jgi:hypothetical protein